MCNGNLMLEDASNAFINSSELRSEYNIDLRSSRIDENGYINFRKETLDEFCSLIGFPYEEQLNMKYVVTAIRE